MPIELSLGKDRTDKALIVLHGWGANQHDLVPLVRSLNMTRYYSFFPNAPFDVPGTAGTGKAWFSFPLTKESQKELLKSKDELLNQINEVEKRGFNLTDIVLIGFSQGATMVLELLLSHEKRIGAVISLSGFLIDDSHLLSPQKNTKKTPLFIAHGYYDPILPFKDSKKSMESLLNAGLKITWKEYPMAHEIIADEIDDIRFFLTNL